MKYTESVAAFGSGASRTVALRLPFAWPPSLRLLRARCLPNICSGASPVKASATKSSLAAEKIVGRRRAPARERIAVWRSSSVRMSWHGCSRLVRLLREAVRGRASMAVGACEALSAFRFTRALRPSHR